MMISPQHLSKWIFTVMQNSPSTLSFSALPKFGTYRKVNNPIPGHPLALSPGPFLVFHTCIFFRIRIQFILWNPKKMFIPRAKLVGLFKKNPHDILLTMVLCMTSSPDCVEKRSSPVSVAKDHYPRIEFVTKN